MRTFLPIREIIVYLTSSLLLSRNAKNVTIEFCFIVRVFYELRYTVIIELVRTFYLKSVPANFQKYLKHISYQRGKFVKTVVQPSSSLPEHQLQPSSPFVATIVMANIFYIE